MGTKSIVRKLTLSRVHIQLPRLGPSPTTFYRGEIVFQICIQGRFNSGSGPRSFAKAARGLGCTAEHLLSHQVRGALTRA